MMTRSYSSGESAASRPITVEVPRAYEGLGAALKSAYGRSQSLPEDMCRALDRLDQMDFGKKGH